MYLFVIIECSHKCVNEIFFFVVAFNQLLLFRFKVWFFTNVTFEGLLDWPWIMIRFRAYPTHSLPIVNGKHLTHDKSSVEWSHKFLFERIKSNVFLLENGIGWLLLYYHSNRIALPSKFLFIYFYLTSLVPVQCMGQIFYVDIVFRFRVSNAHR